MPAPSVDVVDQLCKSACKAMKLQSKQLLMLNASYAKQKFNKSADDILKALQITVKSIHDVQNSLTETAILMNQEFDKQLEDDLLEDDLPTTYLVTQKEYIFYNVVLQEYYEIITASSKDFSLFSSPLDRESCLANVETLKAS